ncbi:MAG: alpha-amylase family glycosyl hydrolase [Pseudomonadota bacterium]
MFDQKNNAFSGAKLKMNFLAIFGALFIAPAFASDDSYITRPPQDEIIYFILPDRFENADRSNDQGGIQGDRLDHGFDPSHKGFYHGGDLKGLTSRLDYIEKLGATAIWLGPIYKNKPVQGSPGQESAGYHGYWITDFTTIDPHFGSEADLKNFIDSAHARGMKVYLDIITNHTADVIAYRECHDPNYNGDDRQAECPYRHKAEFPYITRGDVDGELINKGFMGDQVPFQTTENFDQLTRSDYAYTPFIAEEEANLKVPQWLNDPVYYHNRSDSTWIGESVTYGDFAGLDDLMTEHPRVVAGMIDIYKDWITKYKVDGFRIDTAKHVNGEFWQKFIPEIVEHAKSQGIPNFYIFGEVYNPNPAGLARFTRVDGFPTVLDFAFQSVVQQVIVDGAPAIKFAEVFDIDPLYKGGSDATLQSPLFVGNHDMGRFAMFIRQKHAGLNDEQLMKRVELAHAMMFYLRGAPVIYYGDEQGFNGDGNDQASREDMFPSQTASYNDNDLIGTTETTATSNFNRRHPLYRSIAAMSAVYKKYAPLRRGRQIVREAEQDGGLLAVSRTNGQASGEYLIVFNASDKIRSKNINVDPRSHKWSSIHGSCPREATAVGGAKVSVPAWGYIICESNNWIVDK